MTKIIKDLRILKAIGLKFGLKFDKEFKYYIGNAYKTSKGLSTSEKFIYKNKCYELKYYSGCFNPFYARVIFKMSKFKIEIYNKKTNEVLETKEVNNLKGFMLYWINQADTKTYGYRIK